MLRSFSREKDSHAHGCLPPRTSRLNLHGGSPLTPPCAPASPPGVGTVLTTPLKNTVTCSLVSVDGCVFRKGRAHASKGTAACHRARPVCYIKMRESWSSFHQRRSCQPRLRCLKGTMSTPLIYYGPCFTASAGYGCLMSRASRLSLQEWAKTTPALQKKNMLRSSSREKDPPTQRCLPQLASRLHLHGGSPLTPPLAHTFPPGGDRVMTTPLKNTATFSLVPTAKRTCPHMAAFRHSPLALISTMGPVHASTCPRLSSSGR